MIESRDEDFEQPLDEDAQGNVIMMHQMNIDGMDNISQTPNKQDTKPSAEVEEQSLANPTCLRNALIGVFSFVDIISLSLPLS
jgi:hypothetical protein